MKPNTRTVLLSVAGLALSASNALAVESNTTSMDIIGNLGYFSTLAGGIMTYAKYGAFFIAIISLLSLWVTGTLGKLNHKINDKIESREGIKKWIYEGVLFVVALIILFHIIIPMVNDFIPSTSAGFFR